MFIIIVIFAGRKDISWSYRGDDGKFYHNSKYCKQYGPKFTTGDTIGCCLNFLNNTIFYTKNGMNLGIYYPNTIIKINR